MATCNCCHYLNDGLIAGSDESEIGHTGTHCIFLGMQTEQCHDGIFVGQHVYMENVLEWFKTPKANPVVTLCDRSSGGTEDSVGSRVPYCESVGCLMYLITGTSPDMAFAMLRAAWALNRPTEADWIDVKCTFKYLRGRSNCGLLYGASNGREC